MQRQLKKEIEKEEKIEDKNNAINEPIPGAKMEMENQNDQFVTIESRACREEPEYHNLECEFNLKNIEFESMRT